RLLSTSSSRHNLELTSLDIPRSTERLEPTAFLFPTSLFNAEIDYNC
ncbi:unnamed protein product, partial [Rotaria magnacalcarata]